MQDFASGRTVFLKTVAHLPWQSAAPLYPSIVSSWPWLPVHSGETACRRSANTTQLSVTEYLPDTIDQCKYSSMTQHAYKLKQLFHFTKKELKNKKEMFCITKYN